MIVLWIKTFLYYLYVLFNSVQVSKPQFLRVDIQNNDRVATAGRPCWKLQMIVLQAPKNVVLDMAAIAPWIASTKRTAQHRGTSIDHWETMVERYESPSSISSGGTLTKEIIRRETPGSIWILGNKDSKVALFETRCHWICREFWLIEESRFYHSSALPHNAHVSLQEMYSQYLQCLSILVFPYYFLCVLSSTQPTKQLGVSVCFQEAMLVNLYLFWCPVILISICLRVGSTWDV